MKPIQLNSNITRHATRGALGGLLLGTMVLGGCDNAGEGLFSGAALGAVTGLVIGSMSGNPGEGAALGAVIGGAGGAIVGDQNERNRENAYISGRARTSHGHPYCSEHRVYHSCSGHSHYHYDEWWHD